MVQKQVPGRVVVPFGDDRRETAILVVGTADDYGIDQHEIKVVSTGFEVPQELADVLYDEHEDDLEDLDEDDFDPSDYNIEDVKAHVTDNPETADEVLAAEKDGQNRVTLVQWLTEFNQTSG